MPCNQILSGLARDCSPSIGGVKRILAASSVDVSSVTVTDNKISAITMASTAKFHEYALPKGTANFSTTINRDESTGAHFYTTTLLMQVNRMNTQKRVEMNALAQNDLVFIVEDMNGAYWYLGKDEAVTATSGDAAGTGTSRTDRNGYGLSFVDNSKELPFEVLDSIVDALVA